MPLYDYAGTNHGEIRCERCQRWATRHLVRGMNADRVTIEAIDKTIGALRKASIRAMLGALVAQPKAGECIKLIAISGGLNDGTLEKAAPHGWTVAAEAPPQDGAGEWRDIYGRQFKMAPLAAGARADVAKPCAAMKLLLSLGAIYRKKNLSCDYSWINMYEEDIGFTDQKRITAFRKMDGAASFGSVSCEACEHRLPLLLCDGDDPSGG